MCCGGNNTTTSTSTVPDYLQSGIQGLIGRGEAAANLPYQTPPTADARVAPFNPTQNQAFGEIQDLQGQYQPFLDQAASLNTQGTTPLAPGLGTFDQAAYDKYSSPYTEGVIGSVNKDIDRQEAVTGQGIAGQAAQAGAFGGDRATIAAQAANRDLEDTRFRTIAGLRQSNFQQAQGQFNTEQNRDLAARESDATNQFRGAAGAGTIASQGQSLGLQGAGSLLASGSTQQANTQAQRDIGYQNFVEQRDYPKTQANFLAGVLHGYPTGSSTATTSPPPSVVSQAAGLGIAGLSTYGIGKSLNWFGSGAQNAGTPIANAFSPAYDSAIMGANGLATGGGGASGADIPWGAVFEARGGMVRPRARFARGGIAGYWMGGGGIGGAPNYAEGAREYGIDEGPPGYGEILGIGAEPEESGLAVPYSLSSPDVPADVAVEQPPLVPPTPRRTPEERMRLALGVLPEAPKGVALGGVNRDNIRPDTTLATDATRLWLLENGQHPGVPQEQIDIEKAALRDRIARDSEAAGQWRPGPPPPPPPVPPAYPVSNAPQDYGNDPPLQSEGQGIAAAEAGGRTEGAALDGAPVPTAGIGGLPPGGGEASVAGDAPAAVIAPNGVAPPPMPQSRPAAPKGIAQPITAAQRPSKGDLVTADGKGFVPGGAATRSLLPSGQGTVPIVVNGQAVQAPAAGQGFNEAQLRATAREAQEPKPGIPDWAIPVMQAGFAMMGGTSPFGMVNIGQGAMQGLNSYQKQRQLDATNQLKTIEQQRKFAHDANTHAIQLAQREDARLGILTRSDDLRYRTDENNARAREVAVGHDDARRYSADTIHAIKSAGNPNAKTPEERAEERQRNNDNDARAAEEHYIKNRVPKDPISGSPQIDDATQSKIEQHVIRTAPDSRLAQEYRGNQLHRDIKAKGADPDVAIRMLLNDKSPQARANFDKVFGQGAADRAFKLFGGQR